jgi:hypothetical protein
MLYWLSRNGGLPLSTEALREIAENATMEYMGLKVEI